ARANEPADCSGIKKAWSFIVTRTDRFEVASGAISAQQPSILHDRTTKPSIRTVLPLNLSGDARTVASETFSDLPIGEPRFRKVFVGIASVLSSSVGDLSLA